VCEISEELKRPSLWLKREDSDSGPIRSAKTLLEQVPQLARLPFILAQAANNNNSRLNSFKLTREHPDIGQLLDTYRSWLGPNSQAPV
jgi:hypothetical protein